MKLYTEEQIRMLDINLEGTTIDEVINCLTPIYITTRTMEQTAVEWLKKRIRVELTYEQDILFEELFDQAKEMEKEQIAIAYREGWNCPHGEGFPETGEQYYEETYKREQTKKANPVSKG